MADSMFEGLVGCAFAEDGRGPDVWNCGWLLVEVFRRKGWILEIDDSDVKKTGEPQTLLDLEDNALWEEVRPPYKELDLLTFRSTKHDAAVHCGLYVKHNRVLHADREVGVVCESLRRLKKFINGAFRYRAPAKAHS